MARQASFFIQLLFWIPIIATTCYQCVWYDECAVTVSNGPLPCVYNGSPKPLVDAEALRFLHENCPLFFPSFTTAPTNTCCSPDLVRSIEKTLRMVETLFARCPICYSNLAHLFCAIACSPEQTRFIASSLTAKSEDDNTKEFITGVDVAIDAETAEGIWQSCRHVHYPQVTNPVVEVLLVSDTSNNNHFVPLASHFLNYFCGVNGPFLPFIVNVKLVHDSENKNKISYKTVHCNETTAKFQACDNSDCPDTKWVPPPQPSCSIDLEQNRLLIHPPRYATYREEFYGPSVRVKQIFIRPKPDITFSTNNFMFEDCISFLPSYMSPVFDVDFLEEIASLVEQIENLTVNYEGRIVEITDVCEKPGYPTNKNCAILHPLQYFQNNLTNVNSSLIIDEEFLDGDSQDGQAKRDCYKMHFQACLDVPTLTSDPSFNSLSCLSHFQLAIPPWLIFCAFNGTKLDSQNHPTNDYTSSQAVIVTVPFSATNSGRRDHSAPALAWENALDNFLANYKREHSEKLEIIVTSD